MFGITSFYTFLLGTILIVLLPGPNSLYVLACTVKRGVSYGSWAALGIILGDTILAIAASLGASWLHASDTIYFSIVRGIGGLYLSYLGCAMIWGAIRQIWLDKTVETSQTYKKSDIHHPFRQALLISLLNPKSILFFISFFVQFVDPHYVYPAISFLMLGIITQLVSIAYLILLIKTGNHLARSFQGQKKISAGLTGGVGTLFITLGGKLVMLALK